MGARRFLARAVAVSATSVVVLSGLSTSAFAVGGLTVQSGGIVLNDTSHQLVVKSAIPSYTPGLPTATLKLTRHGSTATQDVITATGTVNGGGDTITANVDYTLANPGAYDVAAYNGPSSGPVIDSCSSCVTVDAFRPTVTDVAAGAVAGNNTLGEGGGVQPFVIDGQNFAKGLYCQLGSSGCTGPTVAIYQAGTTKADPNVTLTQTVDSNGNSAPTAPTATTITLRAVVNGTDSAGYDDDVVVTNTDGKSGKCSGCLHIAPRPRITSVSNPALTGADFTTAQTGINSVGQNATDATVVIRGDNFPTDAVITTVKPANASPLDTSTITWGSATAPQADPTQADPNQQKITLTNVNTTNVAATGDWGLKVRSPSEFVSSPAATLTVTPAPAGTGRTYVDATNNVTQYGQGATTGTGIGARAVRLDVAVSASNFYPGTGSQPHTTVAIQNLPNNVTVTNQTASVSGANKKVRLTLDVDPNATLGTLALRVVNPDGGRSGDCTVSPPDPTSTCDLTIAAGPRVQSVSPSSLASGQSGSVTITGTSAWHSGTNMVHVKISNGTTTLVDADATRSSDSNHLNQVTVPVTVPNSVTASDFDVTVRNNDDRGTYTAPNAFHVSNLSVNAPSPNNGTNDGVTPSITITGTSIDQNASIALHMVNADVPDIPATVVGTLAPDGSGGTVTFDLTDKSPGFYDLLVTNPNNSDHPGTATCSQCFDVVTSAPTITNISPGSVGAGATDTTITVTGTRFYPGAVLTATNSHMHVLSATRDSLTQFTADVSVDSGTASDSANKLTVTNTDAQSGQRTFPIATGPSVTSMTPTSRAAGAPDFTMTLTGTGIDNAATLEFSNPDITADNYNVTGITTKTLTATVHVPGSVVTDDNPVAVHVAVVNPDGGRGQSPQDLKVDPQPSIDHFAPAAVPAGASAQTIQIIGNDFASGATVEQDASSTGVTFGTVKFVNANELDVPVTVANGAALGDHLIDVGNADGGTTSANLTVFGPPSAPTNLSVTPGDSSLELDWAAPADDGGDPNGIASYTASLTKHSDGTPAGSFTTPSGSVTQHTFSGLTNGVRYDVSVVATNGAGNGPAVADSGIPVTVPSPPTSFLVQRNATSPDSAVDVSWGAPDDNGGSDITGYHGEITPDGSNTPDQTFDVDNTTFSQTFSGLTPGQLYDVTVAAVNGVGTGAADSAQIKPKWDTTLTLQRSANHIVFGDTETLSGTLTRSNASPITGADIINVWRQPSGQAAILVGTASTDNTGAWTMDVQPSHNAKWYATYAGDTDTQTAATEPVSVTVASLVTITSPSDGTVNPKGQDLVVKGTVGPNKAGEVVHLLKVTSSGTKAIDAATLSSKSHFKFTKKLSSGVWHLEVRIGKTTGNAAGTSDPIKVKQL